MASFSFKEMVEDVVKSEDKDDKLNENSVKEMINKLDRRDMIRKHFADNNLRSEEPPETICKFKELVLTTYRRGT